MINYKKKKINTYSGEDQSLKDGQPAVMLVLELEIRILLEIADVGHNRHITLDKQPTHVSPPESLGDGVGILVGVGVPVVCAVVDAPFEDGHLEASGGEEEQQVLEDGVGAVGSVGPESVVARSDAEAAGYVVDKEQGPGGPVVLTGKEAIQEQHGGNKEVDSGNPSDSRIF